MKNTNANKKKIKNTNSTNANWPKFEFIVYEENLDPLFKDLKKQIEVIANTCNKPAVLESYYKHSESSEVYLSFAKAGVNNDELYRFTRDVMEHTISNYIFAALKALTKDRYFPFCCFHVKHHCGTTYKIKISSLTCKKSSGTIAYFPMKSNLFQYEGRDLELGFSKHAIERFYERCVGGSDSYIDYLIFFKYLNTDLCTDRAYVLNPETGKKQISVSLFLPMSNIFKDETKVLTLLSGGVKNKRQESKNISGDSQESRPHCSQSGIAVASTSLSSVASHNVNSNKQDSGFLVQNGTTSGLLPQDRTMQHFWRIGYAPLHVDRENNTAKCATVLIPGMKGTPEYDLLSGENNFIIKENSELNQRLNPNKNPEIRIKLAKKFESFKTNCDKQNTIPGFQLLCHAMGIPQIIKREKLKSKNHIISNNTIGNMKAMVLAFNKMNSRSQIVSVNANN